MNNNNNKQQHNYEYNTCATNCNIEINNNKCHTHFKCKTTNILQYSESMFVSFADNNGKIRR